MSRVKHEMWAGQFYSRGAYTIFRYSKRKVTTLRKKYVLSAYYNENINKKTSSNYCDYLQVKNIQ